MLNFVLTKCGTQDKPTQIYNAIDSLTVNCRYMLCHKYVTTNKEQWHHIILSCNSGVMYMKYVVPGIKSFVDIIWVNIYIVSRILISKLRESRNHNIWIIKTPGYQSAICSMTICFINFVWHQHTKMTFLKITEM